MPTADHISSPHGTHESPKMPGKAIRLFMRGLLGPA